MRLDLEVEGVEEIAKILEDVAPNQATNIARATMHGIAAEIRDDARDKAPREDGILRKAIKAKRRRMSFGAIGSDVLVERRAFYWRFLEYGTTRISEVAFFLRSLRAIEPRLPQIYREQFVKKLIAAIERAKKRSAK